MYTSKTNISINISIKNQVNWSKTHSARSKCLNVQKWRQRHKLSATTVQVKVISKSVWNESMKSLTNNDLHPKALSPVESLCTDVI